jgi:hypothetical protein
MKETMEQTAMTKMIIANNNAGSNSVDEVRNSVNELIGRD